MFSKLQKRIIEITFQEKLAHLSSCLSAAPILEEIYKLRGEEECFILSNGHAGVALYCLLEEKYGINPINLLKTHGIHPGKDLANHLYCSTGSLGSGLPIAVGHALATPNKKVWCMISDGECAEGSIWESLRFIAEHPVSNLEVYVNINGFGAYDKINIDYLSLRLKAFLPRIQTRYSKSLQWSFAKDLQTHYCNLTESQFNELMNL